MWKVIVLSACLMLIGCGDAPEEQPLKSLEVRVVDLERAYELSQFSTDVIDAARKSANTKSRFWSIIYNCEEDRIAQTQAIEHAHLVEECNTIARLIRAGVVELK